MQTNPDPVQHGLIGGFVGNPKLTTAAGKLVGTAAPMSLTQDAIMKGTLLSSVDNTKSL